MQNKGILRCGVLTEYFRIVIQFFDAEIYGIFVIYNFLV